MWHPCGTVKMGKPEDPGTCVDKDFRVLGLDGIRVVDMSISPILPEYVALLSCDGCMCADL